MTPDNTNYEQAIKDIYSPQEKFIQDQIAALPAQYEPQKASIEQAKVNAFKDISKEAFKRGRFFGGFQPAEQARYLGEKYLPGLQQLTLSQQEAQRGLLGKSIELGAKKATDILSFLETRRKEQDALAAEQRGYVQQEKLANISAAATRSGNTTNPKEQRVADIGAATSFLRSVAGGDKYVHQQDYQQAKDLWANMGYNSAEFDSLFKSFRNPANNQYKLG